MAVRGTASRARRRPKALRSRRSGRVGEPPGASGSLADVPHRPRLPSCPTDRPRDLYGSFLRFIGIRRSPGVHATSEVAGETEAIDRNTDIGTRNDLFVSP